MASREAISYEVLILLRIVPLKFIFSTFSDDSYRYYNSLSEQREGGSLDIFGGEVVPVFTNVNNGLGILLSKNAQEFNIKP